MGRFVSLSLALLFLANVIPSKAQKAEVTEKRVTVAEGAPLTLECRLRPEQRSQWLRDGGALPDDLRVEPERPAPDGRLAARLRGTAASPRHAGVYTCSPERDQRVRLLVQPATPPAADPASPKPEVAEAAGGDVEELVFELHPKGNFSLECKLPNDNGLEYIWKKNDTLLEKVWDLKDRSKLELGGARLTVTRGYENDFGNYSCALPGGAEQRWAVRPNPYAKLLDNTNVVEGQKLKIVCKVVGKPYPTVTWWFKNSTDEVGNFTEVTEALGERAQFERNEAGVENAVLVLAVAQRSDAGTYRCLPGQGHPDTTVLRVKDMYAALWPFLGICAEVFILCAIILVYEKRRTKPELDDSDTDNHDQKKS